MTPKKKKMIWIIVGIVIVVLAFVAIYVIGFRSANPPLTKEQVTIDNATFSAEIATSTIAQMRGLSFRTSLGANDAMLFVFASSSVQSFWMKDMNFSLDMIWIGDGKVLGFAQNAAPQPGAALWNLTIYNSPDGTNQVLEVNAGTVAKYGIKVGDAVSVSI